MQCQEFLEKNENKSWPYRVSMIQLSCPNTKMKDAIEFQWPIYHNHNPNTKMKDIIEFQRPIYHKIIIQTIK